MAPALSTLKNNFRSICLSIAAVGVMCLGYIAYRAINGPMKSKALEKPTENDDKDDFGENRFKRLLELLDSVDDEKVSNSLRRLGTLTAFKEFQVLIRELGGLKRIMRLLKSESMAIKGQALNVMNNLAMNAENQVVLRDLIPDLAELLCQRDVPISVHLAVTRVLTNLTTLDENHDLLIPHAVHLFDLLKSSDKSIQLQILKILVNLSTNRQLTENLLEFDLQIIDSISDFVDYSIDEELLLRAITCLTNILSSLKLKWQIGNKRHLSVAEFVPSNMEEKLRELTQHSNEEIRTKSEIGLASLREPGSLETSFDTSMSEPASDLVEILRL
eukprot:gene6044-6746_t